MRLAAAGGNGRILVAEQAGSFVPARYPPTDLGPLKISQESLKRLANAFGVPEALLSKDATYANMQASLTLYARNTILPRVLILEQKLNEMLVSRYGPRLFLAAENPVPADETFELQKVQIAIDAGVLTPNEIRMAAGFKPLEDQATYANPSRQADQLTTAPSTQIPTGPNQTADASSPQPRPAAPAANAATVKLLLAINRAVAAGQMRRLVAIHVLMRELNMNAAQARQCVGRRKRPGHQSAAVPAPVQPTPAATPQNVPQPPPQSPAPAEATPPVHQLVELKDQSPNNPIKVQHPDDTQIV